MMAHHAQASAQATTPSGPVTNPANQTPQAMGNRKRKLHTELQARRNRRYNAYYQRDPVYVMHQRSYFFDKNNAGIGFWITRFWNFIAFLSSACIHVLVAAWLWLHYVEGRSEYRYTRLETEADLYRVARFGYMLSWWLHFAIITNVLIQVGRLVC
jgi:hypothetical protein